MEKKRAWSNIFLLVIVLVAILHSVSYVIFYYAKDLSLENKNSLSGFSVQDGSESKSFSYSGLFIILEWIAVLFTSGFLVMRQKTELKDEISSLYLTKQSYATEGRQTDIDILYELLKEKKHLKIASIAQVFDVPKYTVMEWAKILKNGNLAEIYYPQIGEPEITIIQ